MADKLKSWDTTPGNNNQTPPDGWPEGMAPSTVNDTARTDRARMREWYEDATWINAGHSATAYTSSSVTISGDVTATYVTDRAIRFNADPAKTAWVTGTSLSGGDTVVNFTGTSLSANPSVIEYSHIKDEEDLPLDMAKKSDSLAPPGYVDGMALTKDADSDHDIKIAVGTARDSGDNADITLSSALTKQLDTNWAAGDDAGGLASAVTLSGPETVYVFVIAQTDGTVDAGFDTDGSATNLLSDASSYSYYRKIGVIITDSSNNIDQACSYPVLDAQLFASSGTWNKPSDGRASDTAVVELVGGGASGQATRGSSTAAHGGSGGGFVRASVLLSDLSSSESVTVGSGGASQTPASASVLAGQDGGDTSFAGYIAKGGNGGSSTQSGAGFELPSFPAAITDKWGFTSGGSTSGGGENAIFAGGGGGTADGSDASGGTSWKAGDGGGGDNATAREANGGDGETPGGGGGGAQAPNNNEANSGAGGDGQAVIYVIRGWVESGIRGDVC